MGSIFDGPDVDAAAQLAEQRAAIAGLLGDVAAGTASVPTEGTFWRSDSQRRYAVRLAELREQLECAWRQLDAAADAVDRARARVPPGGSAHG
ncbi:MAG TPA: hypothetical protein VGO31_09815 [Microbacteriaceae bacterium]|nr:hypothetical protein [Microbacteriaceae bacterium]